MKSTSARKADVEGEEEKRREAKADERSERSSFAGASAVQGGRELLGELENSLLLGLVNLKPGDWITIK